MHGLGRTARPRAVTMRKPRSDALSQTARAGTVTRYAACLRGSLPAIERDIMSIEPDHSNEPHSRVSASSATIAIAFSGGLGLAAYHAGVYQAFTRQSMPLHWVAGSSAGAVTAALIAGNPEADRLGHLGTFWRCPPTDRRDATWWRHLHGWMAALETRLAGSAGFFRPRFPDTDPFRFRSFYDLAPMKERLTKLIDFGRLNAGELRVSIVATDIESGEPVTFDSLQTKLEMDHCWRAVDSCRSSLQSR